MNLPYLLLSLKSLTECEMRITQLNCVCIFLSRNYHHRLKELEVKLANISADNVRYVYLHVKECMYMNTSMTYIVE